MAIPFILYFYAKAYYIESHADEYDEISRYGLATWCVRKCMKIGHITTKSFGLENLPKDGGYVMFPNHQGKCDILGIIDSHTEPCTLVMDAERSKMPIVDPFITLIKGQRLDKTDMKAQVKTILKVVQEVKAGRKYVIFPEGGYENNGNTLQEFKAGAFQCATKSKAPIVPVVIIDSYKAFTINSLRRITTQVHYLPAIPYEEYKEMSTAEIAEDVKRRIQNLLDEKCVISE